MKKRIAIIDKEKCHPIKCGNYKCMKYCPVNRMGGECIHPSEDNEMAVIEEDLCTGCGICSKICPFGAISIVNLPEQLNQTPIHRYGKNGFELYSLPTPIFGKVVGILGQNGIGKSTAIKLLAGVFHPNFGQHSNEVAIDENAKKLLDYFKGTEMQGFVEKLNKKEIKLAYKPQQIELIPKKFKGTVKQLLSQIEEVDMDKIIKDYELEHLLDREISQISGGELQRVTIAATVAKKADVYVFDEPTSYLDIKQRLKIAKKIRKLAEDGAAVLVIEHDLVILDYLADFINIMYGKEGAFGVVSSLKGVREGINAFLSGFIREDNIRFRSYELKFEKHPPVERAEENPICKWTELNKKLGTFELKVNPGEIHKEDIVGIIGENGIGKSTFVKMLAGEIESDKGEINKISKTEEKEVAYKPQYLTSDSDELVMVYLQDCIKKYEHLLVKPLNLHILFEKKLDELSGGELQKVIIAKTLSKDSDFYLLDEPSAYLDVEQRVILSKILKQFSEEKGVTIMVVDHDLLFLDYLSKKLNVFSGKPSINGESHGPLSMDDGMNMFLEELGITFRRDPYNNRPRANKEESVKDREQKSSGQYYYG